MHKRFLSILLLFALLLLIPVQGRAAGNDLDWVLTSDGVLTISGKGDMEFDWNAEVRVPWSPYAANIKKVVIEEGVTSIADSAFYECVNLSEVTLPSTLKSIWYQAFGKCPRLTAITIPKGVTEIDTYAFFECSALTEFRVAEGNTAYSNDSHGVLFTRIRL